MMAFWISARDWIRTSTTFRMLPPEDSASTNFATRAGLFEVLQLSGCKYNKSTFVNLHTLKPQTILYTHIKISQRII